MGEAGKLLLKGRTEKKKELSFLLPELGVELNFQRGSQEH